MVNYDQSAQAASSRWSSAAERSPQSSRLIRPAIQSLRWLGAALLAAPAHRRLWLAGRLKRDDWNDRAAAELHLEDAAWAD